MSWTNSLKLTLESSTVTAGLSGIMGGLRRIGSEGVTAMGKLQGALNGVGNILFKLPDQLRAVQGILNTLSLPSKLAGSAETTSVAFRVLIGDAQKSEEVLGRIRQLAATTPFEFPDLANAARKLAAFGEEADSIPDTLRRIGDVASGTETAIGELAEIYGKARVQGTLFAEDINQLTGRGIPVIQEFAKQLGVTNGEVKELASQGRVTFSNLEQAFRDLTDSGGKFAGMMEEISGTFEGGESNLTDSVKNFLTKVGEGINKGLKPAFQELVKLLEENTGFAKEIGEELGYGIEVGLQAIKDGSLGEILLATFDLAVNRLKDGFESAVKALGAGVLDVLNPATMGERLAKRAFEHAIRPVGVSENFNVVSPGTTAAQERLDKALAGPKAGVDKLRQDRAAASAKKERDRAFDKSWAESEREVDAAIALEQEAASEVYDKYFFVGPRPSQGGVASGADADTRKARMAASFGGESANPVTRGHGTGNPDGDRASHFAAKIQQAMAGDTPAAVSTRRKIRGAVSPRTGAGLSVQGASGLGGWHDMSPRVAGAAPARAQRMAGMGNAAARQDKAEARGGELTLKAAELFLKRFPDLVDAAKDTARNTHK